MNPEHRQKLLFGNFLTTRHEIPASKRWVVVGGGLICISVVLFFVFGQTSEPKSADEFGLAVRVIPVAVQPAEKQTEYRQQLTFTGDIKASRTSELSFERTGRVVDVLVDEGDIVKFDQPLAKLDTESLAAKLNELKANRRQAQANLNELVAGPRQQTIDAAAAEVVALKADLQQATIDLTRRKNLRQNGAVSQEELDRTETGVKSTSAKLLAAQRMLDELNEGTRSEKIESQRAVVSQLDAAIDVINVDIKRSTLRAPFAGKIARRFVDEGITSNPQLSIIRLIEDSQLEAWIGLPSHLASNLSVGSSENILIADSKQTATITRILPEVDSATRTRQVVLDIDGSDSGLSPGQIARIQCDVTTKADGFWVPTDALVPAARGLWSVYVVTKIDGESRIAKRDVQIIHNRQRESYVNGTIQSGDQLVVGGLHRLTVGQRVEPIAAGHSSESSQLSTKNDHRISGDDRLGQTATPDPVNSN